MSHPELQQEQAYVDHAYECLDRMRDTLHRTQDSMATEFAALAIEAWAKRRAKTFQDAEQGLCFGRLTLDAGPPPPLHTPARGRSTSAGAGCTTTKATCWSSTGRRRRRGRSTPRPRRTPTGSRSGGA